MSGLLSCPVEGCSGRRRAEQLMCRAHWWSLERSTRRSVLFAWHKYTAGALTLEELRMVQVQAIAQASGNGR